MAASGSCWSTAARRASASPTAATVSCPRSARISTSPARMTAESSAMTIRIRGSPAGSNVRWQLDGDDRGTTGRTFALGAAINGLDPLGGAGQASAGLEPGAACAVIADSHRHEAGLVEHFQLGVLGTAVLRRVREQLRGTEVSDRLDGRGRALGQVDDQFDRRVAACREAGEGGTEAFARGRWMDPPG